MRKMFEYRIYPTKHQVRRLIDALEACRWLYNHLLEQRKTMYEREKKGLSLYQQQATYPTLKHERPSLTAYDDSGNLVSFEILDASRRVTLPSRIEYQVASLSV